MSSQTAMKWRTSLRIASSVSNDRPSLMISRSMHRDRDTLTGAIDPPN